MRYTFSVGRLHLMLIFEAVAFLDHRRPWPVGDGDAQGRIGGFQVLLHQERGDVHRLADIVEAVRRRIRREHLLKIDVNAEQIADGVLILDAVEAAQNRATVRELGGRSLGVDPLGERLNVFLRRSRFRLRRHLPRPHALSHREPAFPIRRVVEVGPEFVQAEMAFRLRAGVALLTMLGKERAERIVGLLGRLGWGLSPAASRGKRQENEWDREQDGFHGTDFSGGSRRVGESIALCNNLRPACKVLIRRPQLLFEAFRDPITSAPKILTQDGSRPAAYWTLG